MCDQLIKDKNGGTSGKRKDRLSEEKGGNPKKNSKRPTKKKEAEAHGPKKSPKETRNGGEGVRRGTAYLKTDEKSKERVGPKTQSKKGFGDVKRFKKKRKGDVGEKRKQVSHCTSRGSGHYSGKKGGQLPKGRVPEKGEKRGLKFGTEPERGGIPRGTI